MRGTTPATGATRVAPGHLTRNVPAALPPGQAGPFDANAALPPGQLTLNVRASTPIEGLGWPRQAISETTAICIGPSPSISKSRRKRRGHI